jgi:protein-S-isoprenylcysteine O-methyltransferase Ste14
MPEVALFAWSLYFAVAVGYRALHQIKLTRSTGIVMPRRGAAPPEIVSTALIVGSALWSAGAALIGWLAPQAGFFAPALGASSALVFGGVLYAAGVAATLGAQLSMGRSWRMGVEHDARTELVVHGPFRLVRNPIYTAMLLAMGGITALSPSPAALVAYALMFIGLELQVRAVEEPYLLRVHGDTYRAYAARTGRFLPGLGRSDFAPGA